MKNAELEAKHQKYKGRVVLRDDIVKDDSGSYAVFTEQGSSASPVTAAKIMDIISRLPGCDGQAADAVSAYTQVKSGRCSQIIENSKIGVSRHLDSSTTTHNGLNHGPVSKTQSFLLSEIFTVILWQDCYGKGNLRRSYWNTAGRKFQIGNVSLCIIKKDYSYLCMWMTWNWLERNKIWIGCGTYLNKEVDLGEPTSFLDHEYLGCTQRQCEMSKDIVDNYRAMFESRISAGGIENLPFSEKCRISSWSCDMAGSCKEECGTILWAIKQDDATTLQNIYSMHRWPPLYGRRNEICWRIVTNMLPNCSEMLVLGTYWTTSYSMVST